MPTIGSRWKRIKDTSDAEYEVVLLADTASEVRISRVVYKNVRSKKHFTLGLCNWEVKMEKVADFSLDSIVTIDCFEDNTILIYKGKKEIVLSGTIDDAIDLARMIGTKSVQYAKGTKISVILVQTKEILFTRNII